MKVGYTTLAGYEAVAYLDEDSIDGDHLGVYSGTNKHTDEDVFVQFNLVTDRWEEVVNQ